VSFWHIAANTALTCSLGNTTPFGNHENELLSITDEELEGFQISRKDLRRVFTEAATLMKGHTASDRMRPCADQAYGKWEVVLVRYSPISDPLMQDIDMRKKH
jgi:hypothetical protein